MKKDKQSNERKVKRSPSPPKPPTPTCPFLPPNSPQPPSFTPALSKQHFYADYFVPTTFYKILEIRATKKPLYLSRTLQYIARSRVKRRQPFMYVQLDDLLGVKEAMSGSKGGNKKIKELITNVETEKVTLNK